MLHFVCGQDVCVELTKSLVSKIVNEMKNKEIQSLAGDYHDDKLYAKIESLVETCDTGFVFNSDLIGEEPYGYVSDFYDGFRIILKEIKSEFPNIAIDGYIFMNDFGAYECVMREAVHTTPRMKSVKFIRQLQCIVCGKWVNPKDAHTILTEDDEEAEACDLPQGLYGKGICCICC